MSAQLPETVYAYICVTGPSEMNSFPIDCSLMPVKSSTLYPVDSGITLQQYEEMMGAGLMLVVTVIIFAILKRAIEQ